MIFLKTIDIVVPCYNEGESLNLFYEETQRVSKQLPDYKFQYIFVDDGSKDNTYKIMCELAEKDESVNCISFSRNFGKEAAMYAGLQNSSGDYVCIIDADLQHPPKMIIQMMAEIEKVMIAAPQGAPPARASLSSAARFHGCFIS